MRRNHQNQSTEAPPRSRKGQETGKKKRCQERSSIQKNVEEEKVATVRGRKKGRKSEEINLIEYSFPQRSKVSLESQRG